jgi:predicted ATPase
LRALCAALGRSVILGNVTGVSITLLDGFDAAVDGKAVPDTAWRLRKARELVKLLALARGHRLHREQAMDVLWQDRPPASAANNLHQAVHAARQALGTDVIEVRDEQLRLHAAVDVDEFERAAADARRLGTPAAYRVAVSLYRGELLPENRYDDWVEDRRDSLAGLHAQLTDELDGLGLLDGLRGLPASTSSFVGREHELGELRALLARTRLLTLAGTGGAGKTRLALELVRGAETSYASGAAFVELAAIADPVLVVGAAAGALDVRALPGRALVDAVVDFLAPRSHLLVLDNCEHVLDASAQLVDALLRGAPQLSVVATSREPLRVPGEVVFRVPSLAIPDPEQPIEHADLLHYESVRLFVERAAAAAPGFTLDSANAPDVARICFRLDGLPLALELAAGRLGALAPATIAERLDGRFRLLGSGSRAAPTRQQTLAATLQWSHDLLEPDERILFRRLAVFAGTFDLAAVEAVCAEDGLVEGEVADVLARLVEKSLVTTADGGGDRRYRLLETVRLYAHERLDEAGENSALIEAAGALGVVTCGARARVACAGPRGRQPTRRRRHASRCRSGQRAQALRSSVAVLATPDRPLRGRPSFVGSARCCTTANAAARRCAARACGAPDARR